MDFIDAILLGLVEGITEFLPISSTGHLILTSYFLKLTDDSTKTFEIVIQLGAILAVVVLYFQRVLDAFRFNSERPFSGRFSLTCLALTTLPAVVLGLLLHDWVKAALFNPLSVSLALGLGGIVMIVLERLRPSESSSVKSLDELTYRHALLIGLAQCIALWPGMSRSGSTIIGGLLCGLDRRVAAEYSFLAAIPVMFLATGYDVAKSLNILSLSDLPTFAIGFVVAFLSALVAVKFFIGQLQRTSLAPYGVYRILVAGALFWVLSSGN
jgi:undecaprenyl-diphosphatase